MTLPFSFTTGEAVLYATNLPSFQSSNTPSDLSAPGDTDRPKTLDPDSLLGSMLRQDESIYLCPAGSDETLPSIHCLGTNDLCDISPSVLSPSESSLFEWQPIMSFGGDDSCDILSFMGSLGISPDDLTLLQQDKLFLSMDFDGGNNTADLTDGVLSYIQHSLRNTTDRTLSSDVRGNLNHTLQKAPLFSSEDQRLYSISDSHTISQEQKMSFIMDTQGEQEHQNNPCTLSDPYDGTEVTQCKLSHINVQKQQFRIMNQQWHTALMDNKQLPNLPPLQVHKAFGNAQACKNITHVPASDSQQVPPLFQPELQQSGCFYQETSPLESENSYRNLLNTVSISCSQELSSPYITAGDADLSAFIAQDLEELLSSLDRGGMDRNGQLGQNVGMGIRAECGTTHLAQHQNNRPHPNLSLGGYL